MATIKFDKNEYHQGDIVTITYSGVAAGSNFNIIDPLGQRRMTKYVSGSGTAKWATSREVGTGKCYVRLYKAPSLNPIASDTATILAAVPITPTPPKPPEGYTDAFAETPRAISLIPGRYDVMLTLKGYDDVKVADIIIKDKETTTIDINMATPIETKTVTFASDPPNATVTIKGV